MITAFRNYYNSVSNIEDTIFYINVQLLFTIGKFVVDFFALFGEDIDHNIKLSTRTLRYAMGVF